MPMFFLRVANQTLVHQGGFWTDFHYILLLQKQAFLRMVCLHTWCAFTLTSEWCAADIHLAEAFPRCARSILLRCMALAAAQLLGSRCSHERQDTGAREDIGSTAKYGSCGRGGKCCGGRCLFAFPLVFFVFFLFLGPQSTSQARKI